MSAVNEIIKLAEKLKAAEEKVAKLDSLEQAIGEASYRLSDLRAAEEKAKLGYDQACNAAEAQVRGAKIETDSIRAAATAEAATIVRRARELTNAELAEKDELLGKAGYAIAAKQAEIARLEAEEAALGQSIAALKADLEAIKARLG